MDLTTHQQGSGQAMNRLTTSLAPVTEILQRPGRANRLDANPIDSAAFLSAAATYLAEYHDNRKSYSLFAFGDAHGDRAVVDAHFFDSWARKDNSATLYAPPTLWSRSGGPFRVAVFAVGVADVEGRVLGTTRVEPNCRRGLPGLLSWHRDRNFLLAEALIHLTLDAEREAAVPIGPTRNYVHEFYIHRVLHHGSLKRRNQDRNVPSADRRARAENLFRTVAQMLYSAVKKAHRETWVRMRTPHMIAGFVKAMRLPQRQLGAEASHAALATLRTSAIRWQVGTDSPGQIVTASARVCRGPNLASGSSFPRRLRGTRLHA
ncbi:hypothetical protein ACWDUL_01745 [Nocardia niigatensis]